MSKISKKIKPRDLNYERLTNKYNEEEATQQQKIMTNIILNLYQTSFIRTYKMAEKLIDKYRQPVANKAKQHKQFRDQMIKYISVKPKFLNRTDTLIDEGNKKIEQIDDARLINDVEHIDNDKALTTIKINLNTKAAFPDMPDLTEDGSRASTTIDESFENGAPNRDVNYELLIARIKDKILELTSDALSNKESMKIQLGGNFQLYRLKNHESGHIEYIQHNMYCKTKVMNITKLTLNDIIDNLINDLGDKLLSEKQQDSGWKIRRIVGIFIKAYKTRPARGASYIETPIRYNFPKNGLINIRNDDLCCFKWCMKYHQTKKGKHDDRITVLKKVKDNFNYDGINFPTSYDDIAHFEKVNKVSIFIYVIGQKGQILKERCGCIEYANKPILLLRLEDEDKSHYVYIKDISKLLCLSVKRKDQSFKHCLYCDKFVLRDIHDKHISECYKMCYNTCVACLPEEGSKMRFKNHKNKIQRPFIIYSDCEAALKK